MISKVSIRRIEYLSAFLSYGWVSIEFHFCFVFYLFVCLSFISYFLYIERSY